MKDVKLRRLHFSRYCFSLLMLALRSGRVTFLSRSFSFVENLAVKDHWPSCVDFFASSNSSSVLVMEPLFLARGTFSFLYCY